MGGVGNVALLLAVALFGAAGPPLMISAAPTDSEAATGKHGGHSLRKIYDKAETALMQPWRRPPAKKRTTAFAVAVEGVVKCQHCRHVATISLRNSTRLAGAKVRLACRNMRSKTFVYRTAYTNVHGYFRFHVEDYDFRSHGGVRNCIVYLVSSPSHSCYKVTNIHSGRIGAPLTRQKVFPHEILYTVGPFAFAPLSCKSPSSHFKLNKSPSSRFKLNKSTYRDILFSGLID